MTLRIALPSDCGNAPRVGIVSDLVARWAAGDSTALAERLADDATWTLVGRETLRGEGLAERACPEGTPTRLELTSLITHGRLASCDGVLETAAGRIAFSHVLRFAGATKTARLLEVRTFLVELPA